MKSQATIEKSIFETNIAFFPCVDLWTVINLHKLKIVGKASSSKKANISADQVAIEASLPKTPV